MATVILSEQDGGHFRYRHNCLLLHIQLQHRLHKGQVVGSQVDVACSSGHCCKWHALPQLQQDSAPELMASNMLFQTLGFGHTGPCQQHRGIGHNIVLHGQGWDVSNTAADPQVALCPIGHQHLVVALFPGHCHPKVMVALAAALLLHGVLLENEGAALHQQAQVSLPERILCLGHSIYPRLFGVRLPPLCTVGGQHDARRHLWSRGDEGSDGGGYRDQVLREG